MSALPVALQVYSVRDYAEKDFEGTVKQIKAMGYDAVELAGLYGLPPAEMRKILDDNGLPALSAHLPEIFGNYDEIVDTYAVLGCQYIAIPFLMPEYRPSGAKFSKTLEAIYALGERCKAKGMTLLYHNHDFEFNKMPDGVFELDYLYATVPADIIQSEIDTCWVRVAGYDPAAYIKKYAGRCPVVHLKDYFKEGETDRMYGLLGQAEESAENKKGAFEFRPVGHGVQDFPPILEASVASGAKWVVVEQDASIGRTSLEAVRMSREYLKSQGW